MRSKQFLLLLALFFGSAVAEQTKFHGYKVFRLTPKNEAEVNEVKNLETLGLSFWNGPNPPNTNSDVMVPPKLLHIMDLVRGKGLDVFEFISDVQKLIDETNGKILLKRSMNAAFTFDQYHTFEEITDWIKEQAAAHSNIASAFSIGNSYEGRELLVLKISTPSDEKKRAIWLDANIHAREWITSAVTLYIINELLNGNNPVYTSWVDDYDWYILTVHNPDGFAFTHSENGNRLWRKTRSINPENVNCPGADPNRNWDFHWMGGGASPIPCSDTYAGTAAFSEPETFLTSQFINTIATDLDGFISLHSYSQLILIPYGVEVEFPGHNIHMDIGQRAADAIAAVNNTDFTPGNIIDLLYAASGGSMDWVRGVHNVPLTYTFELRDKGVYGFLLPEDQIIPSALELMEGLNVMVDAIRDGIPQRFGK